MSTRTTCLQKQNLAEDRALPEDQDEVDRYPPRSPRRARLLNEPSHRRARRLGHLRAAALRLVLVHAHPRRLAHDHRDGARQVAQQRGGLRVAQPAVRLG